MIHESIEPTCCIYVVASQLIATEWHEYHNGIVHWLRKSHGTDTIWECKLCVQNPCITMLCIHGQVEICTSVRCMYAPHIDGNHVWGETIYATHRNATPYDVFSSITDGKSLWKIVSEHGAVSTHEVSRGLMLEQTNLKTKEQDMKDTTILSKCIQRIAFSFASSRRWILFNIFGLF